MMTSLTQRRQNYKMSEIFDIEYHGENIWNSNERLFSICLIGRQLGTFSSFNNICEHAKRAHYYTPSGYMVKFNRQAILRCTIQTGCRSNYDVFCNARVTYNICVKNINCRKSTYCRHTCPDVDGTIIVSHHKNTVTNIDCETEYQIEFYEEFYQPLRDFIKDNKGFGWERVQKYFCKEKFTWINNELLIRLYTAFNDGQIFVASN